MFRLFRTPRRMEDLALFSRHLAGALTARVPLPDVLRAFMRDSEDGALGKAIGDVADDVEQGKALSEAMERHPEVFAAPYRKLVRLGEQGHSLPGIMRDTADRFEDGLRVYEQFRRSAAYPLIILMVLFSVCTFLTIKILPKWQDIFMQLGFPMEKMFAHIFSLDAKNTLFAINILLLIPCLYLLAALLGLRVWGWGPGRMALSLPVIGPIMRLAESANFASYLSLLLEHRVPLPEALGLIAEASENTYVRDAILEFRSRYEQGEKLGRIVEDQPLLPAGMAVMIAAAEDQGELALTLEHLGRFYRDRTTHGLLVMREILEPILLILIGLFVTFVAILFYFPIFQIPKLIG
ncbi:MAG: type II secretion system F family protein [Candidatus Sumerlaeia bacterium]